MKDRLVGMSLFMSVILLFAVTGFAENPVVQTNFTADPAPMVYNDTVFLFTGHDEDSATNFAMYDYLLYTSTDLVNWRDRGVIASTKSFKWASANGAWASQCIYRNGKFYYYCAMNQKGIGVLVSSSPYGPFTDPLGKALIYHSGSDIDPTVFIDDDGQAYLYWGNPQAFFVKLNENMTSYSGTIDSVVPKLSTYQEGPWFYKRNGHYYLAWSSTCCPEGMGYAMSTSPTGPWTYKGSIMDGNSNSSGNQPGIFDFKGKSYTFGFNNAINYSLTTVKRERRSVCLTALTYNADGTIPKLAWFGPKLPEAGVAQVGTLNPYDTTQAETICFEKGVRTQVCGEGGMNVDSIHNGDYIKVKGVNFGTGASSFIARVASATSGGNIELRLDTTTGTLVGTCAVAGTGGWQTWTTKSCTISGATGVHDLYLQFTGTGTGLLFNFNWWQFISSTGIKTNFFGKIESNSRMWIATGAGKIKNLHLDLEHSCNGRLNIALFDMRGRIVSTLYTGELTSQQHLTVPVNAAIRSGAYIALVTLNGKTLINKNLLLN